MYSGLLNGDKRNFLRTHAIAAKTILSKQPVFMLGSPAVVIKPGFALTTTLNNFRENYLYFFIKCKTLLVYA